MRYGKFTIITKRNGRDTAIFSGDNLIVLSKLVYDSLSASGQPVEVSVYADLNTTPTKDGSRPLTLIDQTSSQHLVAKKT